jgi:hypothetical protein
MTKQEAIELENKCDELMTRCLKEDCQVSMALNGRLKVYFDDGFVTLNKDNTPHYIKFTGFYDDLAEHINKIVKCIEDNAGDFEQLMWSYEHVRELEYELTKIKILNADIFQDRLEVYVNAFIADKNVKDIKYQVFTYGKRLIYSAMVIYEENEE